MLNVTFYGYDVTNWQAVSERRHWDQMTWCFTSVLPFLSWMILGKPPSLSKHYPL